MKAQTLSRLLLILLLCSPVAAQNLKPEEIVSKHLAAVGTQEKRAALKTIMALGASEFESNVPVVKGNGRVVVVSDPGNLFFLMSLNSKDYPFEKIGYFNGKPSLPFITAGVRSLLGAYIADHSSILGEGLFGGAMSLRWPLFDTQKNKPRLSGGGTKKIEDKKCYVANYVPAGGGSDEFTIKLYFDAETFDHVRTEYRYEVTPRDATFGQQNRRASAVATLTELFSDFRTIDGLRLPHYHRAELANNGNSGMFKNIWGVRVVEYRLNQALQPDFFTFDAK